MSNDQHQEYVDAATRAAFTGEAGHETRGPGAAIRARIGAQALRALADRVDLDADRSRWPTSRDFDGNPFRPALTVDRLRAEADRLENNTKENHA